MHYRDCRAHSEVLDDIDQLSLSVFGFPNDLIDLGQSPNSETRAVDGIGGSNSDSHIRFLYGDQIVGPVPHHSDLVSALPKHLLPKGPILPLCLVLLLMHADDQRFVFGRYSGEHFDFAIQKGVTAGFHKIVVDGIEKIGLAVEGEIGHFLALLNILTIAVPRQSQHLHLPCLIVVFFALQNSDRGSGGYHPHQNGGLDAQKDVVACYDLGRDLAVCQSRNRLTGVLLQQVHESHHAQNASVLQEAVSVQFHCLSQFAGEHLSAAEGNASIPLQGQLFDKLPIARIL